MLEIFPDFFSCSNIFLLSQNSVRSSGMNNVESPEAMIAGGSSNLIGELSLAYLLPAVFCSKCASLETQTSFSDPIYWLDQRCKIFSSLFQKIYELIF